MNLSQSLKAYEEGIIDGIKEGHSLLLLHLLKKKFNNIPEKYADSLNNLDIDNIISIALNIFDIEVLEDLDKLLLSF